MSTIKDQAICLRAVNYSETSQVVTLLTRDHGKIGAMAKGARRARSAFDGAIEPFAYGQAMWIASPSAQKLDILTELVQSPRFRLLRTNLSAMHAGLFALELTEAFCQSHDPHPALFDALAAALDHLTRCQRRDSVLAVLMDYQLTLLDEAGIAPVLDACANCGMIAKTLPRELYFSSAANGLLCGGCEQSFSEKRRISAACAAALNRRLSAENAPGNALSEAEHLLIYHFTELLGRPAKMSKYFVSR